MPRSTSQTSPGTETSCASANTLPPIHALEACELSRGQESFSDPALRSFASPRVQRMIKQTKKKPSKSELRQSAAASGSLNGRRGSFDTASTSPSVSSFDKTGKLEEAQLELAGCEDTLRKQEHHVEAVRRRVLRDIVDERLRALEDMGKGLEKAAKRGLIELQTYLHDGGESQELGPGKVFERTVELTFRDLAHPAPFDTRERKPYTPSLESESPSLAPSNSASQNGRDHSDDEDDHHRRQASAASSIRNPKAKKSRGLASVIESSGDSSDDDNANLQVVENKPRGQSDVGARQRTLSAPAPSAPNGNATGSIRRLTAPKLGMTPPPAPSASWNNRRGAGGDSSDDSSDSGTLRGATRSTNRKSQSDIGVGGRNTSIKRKTSRRGGSPASSIYGGSDGGSIRKKRGFFASFKHFFVGNSNDRRTGAGGKRSGSPDSMQRSGAIQWSTRTDRNIRKGGTGGLLAGSTNTANDSSDEDDRRTARGSARPANLVAVTNVGRTAGKKGASAGGQDQWIVEQPGGPVSSRPGVKRSSSSKSTLKTSSLIVNPTWGGSSSKKASSSDVSPASKPLSTKPAPSKATLPAAGSAPVSRSNTVKSSKSTKTLKSSSSKTAGPSTSASASPLMTTSAPPAALSTNGPKRSISTPAVARGKGNENGDLTGPSLMTLVEIKAPKSNNPSAGLTLPRAPGSSIIPSTLTLPSSEPSPSSLPQPRTKSSNPDLRRQSSYTPSGASSNNTSRPHSSYANTSQAAGVSTSPDPHHSPNHRLSSPPPRSAMKGKGGSVTSSTGSSNGTLLQNSPHPPMPQLVTAKAPSPMAQVVSNGNGKDSDADSVYETGLEDNDGKSDDDGEATDTGRPGPGPGYNLGAPIASAPAAASPGPQETLTVSDSPVVRRKSVRMDVPPTPDADQRQDPMSRASPRGPRVPSKSTSSPAPAAPVSSYEPGAWSTRIGAADSSDSDQDESEYAIARRAMQRATRKFEGAGKARDGREKGKGRA